MLKYLPSLIFLFAYSCSTPSKINTSSNNLLVAYNVYVPDSVSKDNYEVFVMNLDGSGKKNITNNADVAWTYLTVNDKILFISDRDTCYRCFFLYETDAAGSYHNKITGFTLRDSWMGSRKNGTELIVNPSKDSLFYIIDRNGNILKKIKPGTVYFNDPTFSPDGKQIVFRGADKGFKKETGFIDELYLMNDDGSSLRKLTTYPSGDTTAQWFNYHAGPPRWHPKENFISYQSKQGGKSSLFAVTPDGKRHWKLTDLPQQEGWHDWSPDGKWLAIEIYDKEQTQFHIALMNWNTKEVKTLTGNDYKFQQAPVFINIPKR